MKYARQTPYDVDLQDTLIKLLEYMEDRSDADHDGERFVANKEMGLAIDISQLLHQLEKKGNLSCA